MKAAFQKRSDIPEEAFLGLKMVVLFNTETKGYHLYLDQRP
jgi:hypothetical protein